MTIDSSQLMPLLKAIVTLTPAQQEIFLFCLENLPHPRPYTGDLLRIRTAVGCKSRTAQVALQQISKHPLLSQLVKYQKINIKEAVIYEYYDRKNETAKDHLCTS